MKETDEINDSNKPITITKKQNTCNYCNKKSHILTGCKCNQKFCFSHLQPEVHNCSAMEVFRKDSFAQNEKKLIREKTVSDKLVERI